MHGPMNVKNDIST